MKNICEESEWLLLNSIKKESPTQVFSCEFCEFFKNTSFVEHILKAGSETPVSGFLFHKFASQEQNIVEVQRHQQKVMNSIHLTCL